MAPNLRPLNFTIAGADCSVPRVNLKLLAQPSQSQQPAEQVTVSASYWDWQPETAETAAAAANDDYWAEASACASTSAAAASPTLALHAGADEDYWNEECYEQPSAVDAYWRGATHAPSSADAYWSEDSHAPTASDAYWQQDDRATASRSDSYWEESSHELSAADRYWSMATL
jgi:hypothetical protein